MVVFYIMKLRSRDLRQVRADGLLCKFNPFISTDKIKGLKNGKMMKKASAYVAKAPDGV